MSDSTTAPTTMNAVPDSVPAPGTAPAAPAPTAAPAAIVPVANVSVATAPAPAAHRVATQARTIARPPVRPIQRVTQKPSPDSMFLPDPPPEKKVDNGPFRIFLYGVEGVGKTRFGAASSKPIFITPAGTFGDMKPKPKHWVPTGWANDWTTEDVTVDGVTKSVTSAGVMTLIRYLTTTDLPYQTLVIDELGVIESMVIAHVCKASGGCGINDGKNSYGVGWDAVRVQWELFTAALDDLRKTKKMDIVMLAHADTKKFSNPEGADYDRYHFRLSKKGSDVLYAWNEIVLFANYRTIVQLASKSATKGKGVADGRVMYSTHSPAWDAKNRHSLPSRMPLSWPDLWNALHPTTEDVAEKCVALRGHILHGSAQLGDADKHAALELWLEKIGDNVHKLELCLNNLTAKLAALAESEAAQESGETT